MEGYWWFLLLIDTITDTNVTIRFCNNKQIRKKIQSIA